MDLESKRERGKEGSHDNNFNTDATAKNYRDDQISGTIYSLIGGGAGWRSEGNVYGEGFLR